jgi:hypothetical protein
MGHFYVTLTLNIHTSYLCPHTLYLSVDILDICYNYYYFEILHHNDCANTLDNGHILLFYSRQLVSNKSYISFLQFYFDLSSGFPSCCICYTIIFLHSYISIL